MRLFTDHHFVIGRTHQADGLPCQDYALSETHRDGQYAVAIVSDGCSSGDKTDVGARLIALETAKTIYGYLLECDGPRHWPGILTDASGMANWVVGQRDQRLTSTRQAMRLTHRDMLATCNFACASADAGFIHVEGDGVFAVKRLDGSIAITRVEWPKNMPFYPAYRDCNSAQFIQAHGSDLDAHIICVERWHMPAPVSSPFVEEKCLSLRDGMAGLHFPLIEIDQIEMVAIFTDGISQIDGVDWKDAVRMFMEFKNVAGNFVKRRMNRGIVETMKFGRGPLDDLAQAVIRIDRSAAR